MARICVLFTFITLSVYICFPSSAFTQDPIKHQRIVDGARWGWLSYKSNPFGCIHQCGPKYGFHFITEKGDVRQITIKVTFEDNEVYSWKGHLHSVFIISNDKLFYPKFSDITSGGEVVAVDLTTGKKLWASRLRGLGPVSHSIYSNRMNIEANRDVISILGSEAAGKYLEVKSVATGETIAHRVFENTYRDRIPKVLDSYCLRPPDDQVGMALRDIIPVSDIKLITSLKAIPFIGGHGTSFDHDLLIGRAFNSNAPAEEWGLGANEGCVANYAISTKTGELYFLQVVGPGTKESPFSGLILYGLSFCYRFEFTAKVNKKSKGK